MGAVSFDMASSSNSTFASSSQTRVLRSEMVMSASSFASATATRRAVRSNALSSASLRRACSETSVVLAASLALRDAFVSRQMA